MSNKSATVTVSRLNAHEFATGIVGGLCEIGYSMISDPSHDYAQYQAATNAFEYIRTTPIAINPTFRIAPHPVNGDAPAWRNGIAEAWAATLLVHDIYPHMRINMQREEAYELLRHVPGDPELWINAAHIFADHLQNTDCLIRRYPA